jgi:hypothetical protein
MRQPSYVDYNRVDRYGIGIGFGRGTSIAAFLRTEANGDGNGQERSAGRRSLRRTGGCMGARYRLSRVRSNSRWASRARSDNAPQGQPAGRLRLPRLRLAGPRSTSSFEFCENGAKAVSWEATTKRTTPDFFARHSVSELWQWNDFGLEDEGRLTHPMRYDAASDRYLPISWDEAFARIGAALKALPDRDMAEFYTSGRASNEAAFLYQFVRAPLRHQQLPRLLEHVPRSDERRSARVHRRRQRHCDARGLRPLRRHLLHRTQSRHQPSANARDLARRRKTGARRSSCSIRCASAASNVSPRRRTRSRW